MTDNTEKKKTYYYDSQKKYNDKNRIYAIKYLLCEIDVINAIEKASCKYKSKQQFIKTAIYEKLERDGFLIIGTGNDEK